MANITALSTLDMSKAFAGTASIFVSPFGSVTESSNLIEFDDQRIEIRTDASAGSNILVINWTGFDPDQILLGFIPSVTVTSAALTTPGGADLWTATNLGTSLSLLSGLFQVSTFDVNVFLSQGVTLSFSPGAFVPVLMSGRDFITGSTGNDKLFGYDGNDDITGGGGNDVMVGGAGDDTYHVDSTGDVVVEAAGQGNDTVISSVDYNLGTAAVENLTLTGGAAIGIGSAQGNKITGDAQSNTLVGGAGDDILDGGAGGNDVLIGGAGNDTYVIHSLNDQIVEGVGGGTDFVQALFSGFALPTNFDNLRIGGGASDLSNLDGSGNSVANLIFGNGGNNIINGEGGNDTMDGGNGDDTYFVDSSSDKVTDTGTLNSADDVINASASFSLANSPTVENLVLTAGAGNINATGNGLANDLTGNEGDNVLNGGANNDVLSGGDGNDVLIGGAGNDSLDGGNGIDTADYSGATAGVTVHLDTGTVTGNAASVGTDTLANIEIVKGSAFNDTLFGGSGSDTLVGGGGMDTFNGGAGDDTYVVDSQAESITDSLGIDTIVSSVTYTLASRPDIENLTLTGTAANGTGNDSGNVITGDAAANVLSGGNGDDTLVGNAGNDTLDGGLGNDDLDGGAGNDIYVVDSSEDEITDSGGIDTVRSSVDVDLTDPNFSAVENVVLLNGFGDLFISGNGANNVLTGNDGNNAISGGAGNDIMTGGAGNDTYNVDSTGDVVVETIVGTPGANDADTVNSSISYTLGANVENLVLQAGAGNLTGTGNGLRNFIQGNEGDNILNGGAGNDILDGGLGNDTYIVDSQGDTITDTGGTDTILSSAAQYNMDVTAPDVENLTLTGIGNINAQGNALNNVFTGNAGANTFTGREGDDTYFVGAGDTVLESAGQGNDTVFSTVSFTIQQNVENLTLLGSALNATALASNNDANILTGNALGNILDGGGGDDTMIGGAGNDTYIVDSVNDLVEDLTGAAGGIDTVKSSVDYLLNEAPIGDIENLVLTGSGDLEGGGTGANNVITGNSGNNFLHGEDGNDTLTGGAGNDILDGGAGNDIMNGGNGDDTYVVDSAKDVVQETIAGAAGGTDTVESSVSFTLSANLENLLLTGSDNINGIGNGGINTITGNDGDNLISGGAGNDILDGGNGDDTLDYSSATAAVNVDLSTNTVSGGGGIDTILHFENIKGSAFADHLTGDDGANTLLGGAGNDVLDGGNGDDIADYSTATTAVVVNLLTGVATGGAGTDTLISIEGVRGGAGNDTFTGGNGDDSFYVNNTGDKVLDGHDGTDTVFASVTYTLATGNNVENLALLGTANINATGNELNNVLTGNTGDNVFVGGGGDDVMYGGGGNDTVDYSGSLAGVTVNLMDGTATSSDIGSDSLYDIDRVIGTTLDDTITGCNEDDTLIGGNGDDTLDGGLGNDTLIGGAGNDDLDGGAGSDPADIADYSTSKVGVVVDLLHGTAQDGFGGTDTLHNIEGVRGGAGNDMFTGDFNDNAFYVNNAGDKVLSGGGGTDTVYSSVTYSLLANASDTDNLTLTGIAAINGTGNALDNTLTGNVAANILTGGDGNDTYIVGAGDTVVEGNGANSGSADLVQSSVTFTLGLNVENLTLTGTANINGTGNALNNILNGNDGNNVLNGGAGSDTMDGGAGNDTYVVDNAGDQVSDSGGGIDLVQSSVTFILAAGLENLTLTGTSAINGTGNDFNNILIGNAAANLLDGGLGNDTMSGGAGNDVYFVDSAGDVVQETIAGSAGGLDTVASSVDWILGANLENLILFDGAFNGTGNALNNVITGNESDNTLDGQAGNDLLDGGLGNDTLIGGAGNDVFVVDSLNDVIVENAGAAGGTDTVNSSANVDLSDVNRANVENAVLLAGAGDLQAHGSIANNVLTGNEGNNLLQGDAGNDTLIGGNGDDVLDGGAGNDTMVGGAGNDTYIVDSTGDVVQETIANGAGGGIDTLETPFGVSALAANLDNVILLGTNSVNVTGNASANIIEGNSGNNQLLGLAGDDTIDGGSGNDLLDGGAGNDIMTGGNGDDTYVVDSVSDQVFEDPDQGIDTIRSSVNLETLVDNVENATLTGTLATTLNGNVLDNILTGNGLNNTINGGDGNDTLIGGLGNDTLSGGNGDDRFIFDPADGQVNGGAGTDTLVFGGAGQTLNLQTASTPAGATALAAIDARYESIEQIDLSGTGNNTLVLDPDAVRALTDVPSGSTDLYINGNTGDIVSSLSEGWVAQAGTQTLGDITYALFTHTDVNGTETLHIDTDISFTLS